MTTEQLMIERKRHGLKLRELAEIVGASVRTVEDWSYGRVTEVPRASALLWVAWRASR